VRLVETADLGAIALMGIDGDDTVQALDEVHEDRGPVVVERDVETLAIPPKRSWKRAAPNLTRRDGHLEQGFERRTAVGVRAVWHGGRVAGGRGVRRQTARQTGA